MNIHNRKKCCIELIGGKGYYLSLLDKYHYDIPKGFIIDTEFYIEFLKDNDIYRKIYDICNQTTLENYQMNSYQMKKIIYESTVSNDLVDYVNNQLAYFSVDALFAIRSSSTNEDSIDASFAGMHDSFLDVKYNINEIVENIKSCWASLFNERAIVYKLMKNIDMFGIMAVIVQEMVRAEMSGVIYTRHPLEPDKLLIEYGHGLGANIVDGKISPYQIVVDLKNLKALNSCNNIAPEHIKVLVEKSNELEKIFHRPQDIEWCLVNNKIYFLQSRPISNLGGNYHE